MIEVLRLLHELEQGTPRYSLSYYCRHLDKYEEVPQFGHGFPDSSLSQKDWIWIAYSSKDDSPLAIIIAAPTQNLAFLMRAYAISSAPKSVFVGLLRKSLADISSRGYTKYVTSLSLDRPQEAKLARLIERAGGSKVTIAAVYQGDTNTGKW